MDTAFIKTKKLITLAEGLMPVTGVMASSNFHSMQAQAADDAYGFNIELDSASASLSNVFLFVKAIIKHSKRNQWWHVAARQSSEPSCMLW